MEEKVRLKKILKISTLSFVMCIVFFAIGAIYIFITKKDLSLAINAFKFGGIMVCAAIFIIDVFCIILYTLLAFIKKKETVKNDGYVRDLPEGIPPAVASLLIDYTIDNERDYTATVASLIAKRYIEINDNQQIKVLKNLDDELFTHEKIALYAVSTGGYYSEEAFKLSVRNDAERLGLIEKSQKSYAYLLPIFFLIFLFLTSNLIFKQTNDMIYYIVFAVISVLLTLFALVMTVFSIQRRANTEKGNYVRTELGNEQAIKIAGLKNFLHDYTNLSEKDLQDAILYDEYISFAIALGEAEAIESFILNNTKYRNLVYKRNENTI